MSRLACFVALVLAAAVSAAPTVTRGGGSLTVTNDAYTAVLAENSGVLQRLTTAAFGDRTQLTGGFTYADIGVLAEGSHPFFGSTYTPDARVEVRSEGETAVVSVEGRLALQDGKLPQGPKWRYRYRYAFDAGPSVRVTAGVQTDTARPPAGGFLATTVSVAGVNEWFADTPQGMQWVDLGPENARCFELHNTPLRPERRRLGLLNHDSGAVVLFDNIRGEPAACLEDIILHSSGTGQVTAFFNWLSGQKQTVFEPGKWYDLSYEVSVTGSLPE